jgi:hypothetical protein
MPMSDAWKKDPPKHKGYTRYQKVVIWAIGITLLYQILFTILMILFPDTELLWKAVLVFSSAISLAGAYVSLRGLWSIESWEQRYKAEVFAKYGIDLDDEHHRNVMSFFTENEGMIIKELDKTNKKQFKRWIRDTIHNINNYQPQPKEEAWEVSFNAAPGQDHSLQLNKVEDE